MTNNVRFAGILVGVALVVSGCTTSGQDEVATLNTQGTGVASGGYLNEATAEYAACLEALGLTVGPIAVGAPGGEGLEGYAEVDGAANLMVDGDVLVGPDAPIGVDGEDRNNEIRECYADHPGAKDAIIDMGDYEAPPAAPAPGGSGTLEAGRRWAQCARDAGVSVIADPPTSGVDQGYVVIPEGVTLDQATMLGETCSRASAVSYLKGEGGLPYFELDAGVVDAEGGKDLAPFNAVIEPASLLARKWCNGVSDAECLEKLGG